MFEARDVCAAHDLIARRASAVAAIFSRLGEGVPLPLVAHELARQGVPVFPCAPDGKRPILEHGYREATTDVRQVEAWWRQRPRANTAIPTGAASGVVVVDVDVHKVDGYAAYGRAERSGLFSEPLAVVTTPTGGRHLYYPADAEREQRSWQVGRAGIDFRGDGGYIIVPPSARMIDGERVPYRVEQVASGAVRPVGGQRLRDFLDPRPAFQWGERSEHSGAPNVTRLAAWVARMPEGERNLGLFKAACRLAESDMPPRDALDVLGAAAHHAGLGEREILRTIGSAYRHVHTYGPRARAPLPGTDDEPAHRARRVVAAQMVRGL